MNAVSSEVAGAVRDAAQGAFRDLPASAYHLSPTEIWTRFANAELISAVLPERQGGAGLAHSLEVLCALFDEAGKVLAHRPLWSGLALGLIPLAEHFEPHIIRHSTSLQGKGRALTVGAFTEGSNASWTPTTTLNTDELTLTGAKSFVWDARDADQLLVSARTSNGGVALVHIPTARDGVALVPFTATDERPVFAVSFDAVQVEPQEWVALESGQADIVAIRRRAEILLASALVGAATTALELTVSHVRERHQFGRAIGSFQAVAMRAADAWIQLEVARASIGHAVTVPRTSVLADAAAVVWSLRAASFTIDAAHHLHGGVGVGLDYPLWMFTRVCRQLELTLGSEARHLLRAQSALAD